METLKQNPASTSNDAAAQPVSNLPAQLSPEQIQQFQEQGYLIMPNFLAAEHCARLRDDVDMLNAERAMHGHGNTNFLVSFPELGLLTSHPPLMQQVQTLMGDAQFAMHHIHAIRQDAGNPGVNWHHDYEQHPQSNRSHLMLHVFFYLNGLNGEIGDLMLVPGTHRKIMNRDALTSFDMHDLPGSIVVDAIPPGTAIIVHSALFHARRAKPGGENRPRYFIDISYCQNGVRWPDYPRIDEINQQALDLNLGRDGQYDFLYDSSQFYNTADVLNDFEPHNFGSTCLQIPSSPT